MNPFNPGAGRKPPYLAGRDEILTSLRNEMTQVYEQSEGTRPVVISGLRGMGKTVFLRSLYEAAERDGWLAIWVEASRDESLAKKLSRSIYNELRKKASAREVLGKAFRRALGVFRSFQLSVDPSGIYAFKFDVEPESGFADSGDLSMDLADLFNAVGEAAEDEGSAVLIAIDELQEASEQDLRALNMALHEIGQQASPVPLFFIGAGLPTLPAVLAKASSYAERMYRYYSLGALDAGSARRALVEPTEEAGWMWDTEALESVVSVSEGYPFLVQQCGYSICEEAINAREIGQDLADIGVGKALEELDRGVYRSRWDRATPRGRDFMRAMAEDESASNLNDLTQRLGKRSQRDLSAVRDVLIKDGLIYAPERGCVAFTIPGMKDFIRRNAL